MYTNPKPDTTLTVPTFCRLCEVMCGLTATVSDGRLIKVRGDAEHPVSAGFACNKGLLAVDIHHDPDRLDVPLRKSDHGWDELSWATATTEIAARLKTVIGKHGPQSVALYLGNPNAFNITAGPSAVMFLLGLGSDRMFSAATQDCANKFTVSEILYGSAAIHPMPDIEHTDYLLLIGTNPRVSKGSFVSTPDPVAAIRRVVERGGTVTFVNPVIVEADLGENIQIKPDTDAFLLAAMLCEIDRTVGFDASALAEHSTNADALRAFVSNYPPERVAGVVGLDEMVIRGLASDFASAPSAAVHTSTGVNMGRQGTLAYFLQQMLSLVTGNLDRRGGNYVPARALPPRPSALPPTAESFEDTPFGAVRRSSSSLPAALLADWIRSVESPIKALISVAGNPVLSFGGGEDLRDALAELDLLVSIDLYRNATGEIADYNLPATDWFERADLNGFTQGMQTTPHIQWTPPVVAPAAQRKPEWQIFSMLTAAMGGQPAVPVDGDPLALFNDGALASVGLSVAQLQSRNRGLAVLDDDTLGTLFSDQILTDDRRIDCAPSVFRDTFERAETIFVEFAAEADDQLKLITRRTRNTLNSALQNVETLKARGASTNPLFMHPADAAARGLRQGDRVTVTSAAGQLSAEVGIDTALRFGVVSMTHGFGNARTSGMSTAQAHPGVNVNELTPTGPGTFDPLSGMTQLTGIPVTVCAAPPVRE